MKTLEIKDATGVNRFMQVSGEGTNENPFNSVTNLTTNDLGRDAWGRPKIIADHSLFSALWTYSVPNRIWLQYNDTGGGFIEQPQIDNNLVKSTHGYLQVKGNSTTDVNLLSRRHPRCQPNRGLLYSTAVIVPTPNVIGTRQFGLFSAESGVFFEIIGDGVNHVMNVVVRTTTESTTTDTRVDITSMLPAGFDVSKGHLYDIQLGWRGVGNFYIFVDLEKVYTFELLGQLTEMSVNNPALHIGWSCINSGGDDITILAACVDITSEGGAVQGKLYTAVSTGTSLLPTTSDGKAILAVKLPTVIDYEGNSVRYTRDMVMNSLTSFCKDEAFKSVYSSRLVKTPNLDALAGWQTNPDSLYQFIDNSDESLDVAFQLDKANMVIVNSTRQEKDFSNTHINPCPVHTPFYLTGGDIIVVEMKSDGTSLGGCTLELAEEV